MFYILAEEILDEIYGKIEAFNHNNNTSSLQVYENSVVNENGAIEAPFHLHDPNLNQPKSLADEILDELYGRKEPSARPSAAKCGISASKLQSYDDTVDHSYEEIHAKKSDLEHSPVITGKEYF